MSKDTKGYFYARVWISDTEVLDIELWSQEFSPTDHKHRSTEEWAREYLTELMSRDTYMGLILSLDSKAPKNGSYQLLLKGVIEGTQDYYGEYDENVDFLECQFIPVDPKYIDEIYGEPHDA